jgi:Lrp/AsnC family transcriptional regulator for asnA, asnC and gidA
MDDFDDKLITLLKRDPRATNRRLAAELSVSEPTIASRIAKLEATSQLRVMAVLDMTAAGFEDFAIFGIRVSDRHPDQVSREIAKIPEVNGITQTFGRFEIVGTMYARDKDHLSHLIHRELGDVPGVGDVESGLVLHTHVHNVEIGTLEVMAQTSRAASSSCRLDDLDVHIIDCLQEKGRMSYREIGRRVDAPEATIRSRMRGLETKEALRLHAVTNVDVGSTETASAWIAMRVRGGMVASVAELLSKRPEIPYLATCLGRFNLMALAVLPSRDALHDFVFEQVAPLNGIQKMETWEIVRSDKHDIRVSARPI